MSYQPKGKNAYKKNQAYAGAPQQSPYVAGQAVPPHPQAIPPPQQQQQQQQAQQAQVHAPVLSFTPTDTIISRDIEKLLPEQVAMYKKLQNREKQIDLIINRKLVDLQDLQAGFNNGTISDIDGNEKQPDETLRIFIYNISENQPWQLTPEQQQAQVQQQIPQPSYTLRVEGRLLDDEPITSPTRRKFSSFLSGLSIQLKDPSIPNNIVEWHDDMSAGKTEAERLQQQFDGMDIKRFGSSFPSEEKEESTTNIPEETTEGAAETSSEAPQPSVKEIEAEVLIQPKSYPLLLQIANDDLAQLVGFREITQHDCFLKIFNYIKVNNLFELIDDKTKAPEDVKSQHSQQQSIIMVKSDELLYKIFKLEKFSIPKLLELLSTTLLKPVDPIKVTYKINTLTNSTLGDVVIDVNLKQLNPGVGTQKATAINKLTNDLVNDSKSALEIQKLQEKIAINLQVLNFKKYKYDFYRKMAASPSEFLEEILHKNTNFLKILTSDNFQADKDAELDEEILRKSEFYKDAKISDCVELLLNSGRI